MHSLFQGRVDLTGGTSFRVMRKKWPVPRIPLGLSFPLCLMGWFAEKINGFQERAHGGGELGGGGQDDAE